MKKLDRIFFSIEVRNMQIDWETRYVTGDTPWEKGAPSPGLVEYLEGHALTGNILVPGCGYGHDVRALASEENQVTGIDIAPSAVKAAQSFQKMANEIYQVADLFDLPADLRNNFDWVWEHTCFCAIEPTMRSKYVKSVADALKFDGQLLAIFYLDPDNEQEGPPYGVTTAELDLLFKNSFELLQEWKPMQTYPGRENRELMRLMKKKC